MNRSIIFPGGGGGNHLRWLMYLDSSIDPNLSLEEKLKFVLGNIYHEDRSFNNWLSCESQWRYSDKYENFIKLWHEPKDDRQDDKSVFMMFDDWDPVLDHYACLSSCFGSEQFFNYYSNFLKTFSNRTSKIKNTSNKLFVKSDKFFSEKTLDKEFYESVVNHFEFENHYKEACMIHERWQYMKEKACKDYYIFYSSPLWVSFLSKMKGKGKISSARKGLLP
jgi:hypothetical protein